MALTQTRQTVLRAAAALTTSYVATSAYKVRNDVQGFLQVAYTMGATETGNSIQIKIEVADPSTHSSAITPAATDWYQPTTESVSGGSIVLVPAEYSFTAVSAAATYDYFNIDIPMGHQFIRVSVKETGVGSNAGTASVKYVGVEAESIN